MRFIDVLLKDGKVVKQTHALCISTLDLSMAETAKATLTVNLPKERYRLLEGSKIPQIGDILELDQAFTSPDGKPMVLAYYLSTNNKYEAEVYETEIN